MAGEPRPSLTWIFTFDFRFFFCSWVPNNFAVSFLGHLIIDLHASFQGLLKQRFCGTLFDHPQVALPPVSQDA